VKADGRLGYLGGRDRGDVDKLEARIRARVDPPDARARDAEAGALMISVATACEPLAAGT